MVYLICKGKIVWVETQTDPRWENRNYSVIKLMDLKSNKTITLSRKSRYLSASISPDGELLPLLKTLLTISTAWFLLIQNRKMSCNLSHAPENTYLQRPQWAEDGKKLLLFI